MFRVGQKVVCISEWDNHSYRNCQVPMFGRVYTIRDLERDGIHLCEIQNRIVLTQDSSTGEIGFSEPSFWPKNFRPVVSRPTDISEFTKMLTDERLPDLVVLHKLLERVK